MKAQIKIVNDALVIIDEDRNGDIIEYIFGAGQVTAINLNTIPEAFVIIKCSVYNGHGEYTAFYSAENLPEGFESLKDLLTFLNNWLLK